MDCIRCTKPDHIRMAKALRYSVYCEEKHWVDSALCADGIEEDELDEHAVHFLALDDGEPVGTARLLLGKHQRLPAADYIDLTAFGIDEVHVAEISRLAIRRHNRTSTLRVFLGLMQVMWAWGTDNSMLVALAVADAPLFAGLLRAQIPTIAVAPEVEFLGSSCVPVAFEVEALGDWCQRMLGNRA